MAPSWKKTRPLAEDMFHVLAKFPLESVHDIIGHDLESLEPLKVTYNRYASKKRPSLDLDFKGPAYEGAITLDFNKRSLGFIFLESKKRDRKTGRRLFANITMLAHVLNMREIGMSAGDWMGAAIWPQAGAYVRRKDRAELIGKLQTRIKILEPFISPDMHAWLLDICALKTPRALFKLATSPHRVSVLPEAFTKALTATRHSVHDYDYDGYLKQNFITDPMRLSHFMLCGLEFGAYIRTKSAWQIEKAENYTRVPVRTLARQFVQKPS